MAIVIVNQGADWNQDLYDRTMERVIPDPSNPPDGLVAHFGGPGPSGGWRVIDIWESQGQWERFRDEILMPQLKKGIKGGLTVPPQETTFQVHNLQK